MAETLKKSNEDVADALNVKTNSTGGNSPLVGHATKACPLCIMPFHAYGLPSACPPDAFECCAS